MVCLPLQLSQAEEAVLAELKPAQKTEQSRMAWKSCPTPPPGVLYTTNSPVFSIIYSSLLGPPLLHYAGVSFSSPSRSRRRH